MQKTPLLWPRCVGAALALAPFAGARADSNATPPPLPTEHFIIDDDDPEANLPTPDEANQYIAEFGWFLSEMAGRADAARGRRDWARAAKYDRALARLAPDRAGALGSLCRDYEALGQRADALQACGAALGKEGAQVDDYARFVRIIANHPGGLDPTELEDATAAIDHLKGASQTRLEGYQLQCELSLRTKDQRSLEDCAKHLTELAPNDPRSITFSWSLALKQGDYARAAELVAAAKVHKIGDEAIARMERGGEQVAQAQGGRLSGWRVYPIVRWLLGLIVALTLGLTFARRRLTRTKSV